MDCWHDLNKEKPHGIPMLEDKLVQGACAKLLTAIYAQDFLECSYGYRPGHGPMEAVKDLTFDLQYGCDGDLVEVDIQGIFDHPDPNWLLEMLNLRIDDRGFLRLIRKWLKAGILETDGQVLQPEAGTVAARLCCVVTPMIGCALSVIGTMPSGSIGYCRSGWSNST